MRLFRTIALSGIVALLVGCGGGSEQPSTDSSASTGGDKLRIAVIPKGSTHEFWKSVHAGAEKAGEELGVEIIWKGPLKEDDRDDQIEVVEDFTTQKVSGIVLAPLDDSALRIPVKAAQDAGIPVVIIDSGLKDIETTSFVATDNKAGGRLAGERIRQLLTGPSKKVIMLRYQEGSASTMEREAGFLEVVQADKSISILSENQHAGPTTESAQKASENLIARFRAGGFDAVYCPNESSTFGMLRALQEAGLAGKVRLVGFDASPKLIEGLKSGEIDALVVQNPFNMGYLGVKTIIEKIKGGTVKTRIDTGAVLVDKANMETPDVAKLIAPPAK